MKVKIFYVCAEGHQGGEGTAIVLERKINEWLEKHGTKIRVERTEQSIVPETRGIFLTIFYTEYPNNIEEGVD